MTTTLTSTRYAEGGFDPEKPNGNALIITEQDVDDEGNPVGEPRVILDAEAGA